MLWVRLKLVVAPNPQTNGGMASTRRLEQKYNETLIMYGLSEDENISLIAIRAPASQKSKSDRHLNIK